MLPPLKKTTTKTTANLTYHREKQHNPHRNGFNSFNGFRNGETASRNGLVFCTQMGILHQLDPTSTQLLSVLAGIEIDPPEMGKAPSSCGAGPMVLPSRWFFRCERPMYYIIPILVKMV